MISTRDNNIKQLPERLTLLELPRPNALANLKRGRRRQANPIDYGDSLPAGYNRQLQAIISAINEEVRRDIIPAIYRAKPEYTGEMIARSEEHTSELQSRGQLVCRRLPEKTNQ